MRLKDSEAAFVLLSGLRWAPVGLALAVLVLIMQARSLSIGTVGVVLGWFSAVALVMELPTGALADSWSRRRSLILGSFALLLGFVTLALAPNLALILLAATLLGVGSAFESGPLPAWFVDASHAFDPDMDLRPGLARGQAAETVGLAIGMGVGGVLPALAIQIWPGLPANGDALLLSLSIPLLLAAALELVAMACTALLMSEAASQAQDAGSRRQKLLPTIRDAAALARRSRMIRLLLIGVLAIGTAISGLELIVPGVLADLRGGPEEGAAAYGLLASIGFVVSALASLAAPSVAQRIWPDHPRRLIALTVLLAGLALPLLASAQLGVISIGYIAAYSLLVFAGPLTADLLHKSTPSRVRSTMLSVESMAIGVGGILGSVLLGAAADATSAAWAFAAMAVVLVLASVAYGRLPEDEEMIKT